MSDSSSAADSALPEPAEQPAVPLATRLSVGSMLKAERVRQGLAVSDVAHRLKYAPRQIEAIESDNFSALPGVTFARGFVRGYAKLLGIDGNPLVASLNESTVPTEGPTTLQLQSVSSSRAQFPARGPLAMSAWPWLLATAAVVLTLGGYSLYQWQAPRSMLPSPPVPPTSSSNDGRVTPAAPSVPPPPMIDAQAPQAGAGSATSTPGGNSGQPAAQTEPGAAGSGKGKIRLLFSGESWTEVRDGSGTVVFSRNSLAGAEQWADGEPPFDLVIGNARDVKLFYRGAEVDLAPYIKVSVARLQLK